MEKLNKLLGKVIIAGFIILVIASILALPLKWLWNWLMPILFELPKITFWQALGISMLSSILFKSSNSTKNG